MKQHPLASGQPFKKSILALCIFAASYPALAAEVEKDATTDEIIITGQRANLDSAQEIKRKSGTVVDSITSEDLGSFPDKSVAEALQRVPGVTVTRFADQTRSLRFTGEPAGVIVRGLPQVRSEFNGRDTFSATSSRGLSWSDVPPELMGGVDVYKNQMAELVEGGIAGTINLRTRLPFDSQGEVKAFSVGYNHNMTSGADAPQLSGLYSNRWTTDAGEFGAMINIAVSNAHGTSQGQGRYGYSIYDDIYADASGETKGRKYLPTGVYLSEYEYERKRKGGAVAFQWADLEGKYQAALQFNRSNYTNASDEHGISTGLGNFNSWPPSLLSGFTPKDASNVAQPMVGSGNFQFAPTGQFLKGTPMVPHGYFGDLDAGSVERYGARSDGRPIVANAGCRWWSCDAEYQYKSPGVGTSSGFEDTEEMVQDVSLNFKWNVTDTIHTNFDMQYVDAKYDNFHKDMSLDSYAAPTVDLTGKELELTFGTPHHINMTDAPEGIFSSRNNYTPGAINVRLNDSFGHEFATRADLIFDVDNGYIQKVKTGIRYSSRFQDVKATSQWSHMTADWQSPAQWVTLDTPAHTFTREENGVPKTYDFKGYPQSDFYTAKWSNKWGKMNTQDGFNTMVFADTHAMRNWENTFTSTALGLPRIGNYNMCDPLRNGENNPLVPGTCFATPDMLQVTEDTGAIYAQIDFGGKDLTVFDRPLSGNFGVRYVRTELESVGGESFPLLTAQEQECKVNTQTDPNQPVPAVGMTMGCFIGSEDVAFMNGGSHLGTSNATHNNFLPSLNLKYEITDELQARFAISRTMSRPDIGLMRNYIGVAAHKPSMDRLSDPLWELGPDGQPTHANIMYSAGAQNPFIKPIQANSIDLTLEYYFSKAGNLTFAAFDKKFFDYIQGKSYVRSMTNNGITKDILVSGPVNGDGASVRGFEIQGTRFFDFLPSPFNGFGVQANYTYVENHGIKDAPIGAATDAAHSKLAFDSISVDALEGMSKNAYSASLIYEKNKWSARMAYSWRSKFLVTTGDADISYPIWSEDYGQLDASVNYHLSDVYQIGLSVSNLTNENSFTSQQVQPSSAGGLRLPSGIGRSEQRLDLNLRANF